MEFCVLGSSSAGNSYILQNSKTALIIDAGIHPKKALKELGHNSRKIEGVIITHSHQDHVKYINDYLELGINCYAHSEMWHDLRIKNHFAKSIDYFCENMESFMLCEFLIMPFALIHDVMCVGYQITHPETGNIVFMTDTKYSPYTFSNITYWLVECNYSERTLLQNAIFDKIDATLMRRIQDNHMSFETLCELFNQSNLSISNKIVLLHLSDNNSIANEFKNSLIEKFGIDTYVADTGLKLNLFKEL